MQLIFALCLGILGILAHYTGAEGVNPTLDVLNISYPTMWDTPPAALQESGDQDSFVVTATPAIFVWLPELGSILSSSLIFGRPSTFTFKMKPTLSILPLVAAAGDYITIFADYLAPVNEDARLCTVTALNSNGSPITTTTTETLTGSILGRTVRLTFTNSVSVPPGGTFEFTCGPAYNSFHLDDLGLPLPSASIVTVTMFHSSGIIASTAPVPVTLGIIGPATSTLSFDATSNRLFAATTATFKSTLSTPYISGDIVNFVVPFSFTFLLPSMCTAVVHGTGPANVVSASSLLGTTLVSVHVLSPPPAGPSELSVSCTGRAGRWPVLQPLMTAVTTNGLLGIVSIATPLTIPTQTTGSISMEASNAVPVSTTRSVLTLTVDLEGSPFADKDGLRVALPFISIPTGSLVCTSLTPLISVSTVTFTTNFANIALGVTESNDTEAPTKVTIRCGNLRVGGPGTVVQATLYPNFNPLSLTGAIAEGITASAIPILTIIPDVHAAMQLTHGEIGRTDMALRIVFSGTPFSITSSGSINVNTLPPGVTRGTGFKCTITGTTRDGSTLVAFTGTISTAGTNGFKATFPGDAYTFYEFSTDSRVECGPFTTPSTPTGPVTSSVSGVGVSNPVTLFTATTPFPAIVDPNESLVTSLPLRCTRGNLLLLATTGFLCTITYPSEVVVGAFSPLSTEVTLQFPSVGVNLNADNCQVEARALSGGDVSLTVSSFTSPTSTSLSLSALMEPATATPLAAVNVVILCSAGVTNPSAPMPNENIVLTGTLSGGLPPLPAAHTLETTYPGFYNPFMSEPGWSFGLDDPAWSPDVGARPSSFSFSVDVPYFVQKGYIKISSPELYALPDFTCGVKLGGVNAPVTITTTSDAVNNPPSAKNANAIIIINEGPFFNPDVLQQRIEVTCSNVYSPPHRTSPPLLPYEATLFATNDVPLTLVSTLTYTMPAAVAVTGGALTVTPPFSGVTSELTYEMTVATKILEGEHLRLTVPTADFQTDAPTCYMKYDDDEFAPATIATTTTTTVLVAVPGEASASPTKVALKCSMKNPGPGLVQVGLDLRSIVHTTVATTSSQHTYSQSTATGTLELPIPIAGVTGPMVLTVESSDGIPAGTSVALNPVAITTAPTLCSFIEPATGMTADVTLVAAGNVLVTFATAPAPAPTKVVFECQQAKLSSSVGAVQQVVTFLNPGGDSIGSVLQDTTLSGPRQVDLVTSLTPSVSETTNATLSFTVAAQFSLPTGGSIVIQLPSLVTAPGGTVMADKCTAISGSRTVALEGTVAASGSTLTVKLPVTEKMLAFQMGSTITCSSLQVSVGTRPTETTQVSITDSAGSSIATASPSFPAVTVPDNTFGNSVLTATPSSTEPRSVGSIEFTVSAALRTLEVDARITFMLSDDYSTFYFGSFVDTECNVTAAGLSWGSATSSQRSRLFVEITTVPAGVPDSIATVTISCAPFHQLPYAAPEVPLLASLTTTTGAVYIATVQAEMPAVPPVQLNLSPIDPVVTITGQVMYFPLLFESWPTLTGTDNDALFIKVNGSNYEWATGLPEFRLSCHDGVTDYPMVLDSATLLFKFITTPNFQAGSEVKLLCGPLRAVDAAGLSNVLMVFSNTSEVTQIYAQSSADLPPVVAGPLELTAGSFTFAPDFGSVLRGSVTMPDATINGLGSLVLSFADPGMTVSGTCKINNNNPVTATVQNGNVKISLAGGDLNPFELMAPLYPPGSQLTVACEGVTFPGSSPWTMSKISITYDPSVVAETTTSTDVVEIGGFDLGAGANVTFGSAIVATPTIMTVNFKAPGIIYSPGYSVQFSLPMSFSIDYDSPEYSLTCAGRQVASDSATSFCHDASGAVLPCVSELRIDSPPAGAQTVAEDDELDCSMTVAVVTARGVPASQNGSYPEPLRLWLFNSDDGTSYYDSSTPIPLPPFEIRTAGSAARSVSAVTSHAPGDITSVTVSLRPLVESLALHVGERLLMRFVSDYEVNAGGASQCSLTVGGTDIKGMTYSSRSSRTLAFMPLSPVPASAGQAVFTCTRIRNPAAAPNAPVEVFVGVMTSDLDAIATAGDMFMPELRPYSIGSAQNMAAIRNTNGKYELNIRMAPLDWPFRSGDVVRFSVPTSVSLRNNTNCRAVMGGGVTKYPIAATTTVDAGAGAVTVVLRANYAQVPGTSNKELNLWCSPVYNTGGGQTTRLIPNANVQAFSPQSGVVYTDVVTTVSGTISGPPSIFNPLPALSDLFNSIITGPIVAIDAIGNLFISFDAGMSFPKGTAVVLFAPEQNRAVNMASLVCLVNGMVSETRVDAREEGTFAVVLSQAFLFLPGEALDIACKVNNEILMLIPLRIEDSSGNSAPINANPSVPAESMARIGDYELSMSGFVDGTTPFAARFWSLNATVGEGDMVSFMIPDGYSATPNTTSCEMNLFPAAPLGGLPGPAVPVPVVTTVVGGEVRLTISGLPASNNVDVRGLAGFPQVEDQYDSQGRFNRSVAGPVPLIADADYLDLQWRLGSTDAAEIACTGMGRTIEPRIPAGAAPGDRVAGTYIAGTLVATGRGAALTYYTPPSPSPVPVDVTATMLAIGTGSSGPALAGQLSPMQLELRALPTSLMPGDVVTITLGAGLGWEFQSTATAAVGTSLAGEPVPALAAANVAVASPTVVLVTVPESIRTPTLAEAQAGPMKSSLFIQISLVRAPMSPLPATASGDISITIVDSRDVAVLTFPGGHAQMPPVAMPEIEPGQGVLVFPFESGSPDATVFFSFAGPAAYGNNSHITFPVGTTLALDPTATHLPTDSHCLLNTRPTAGAAAVSTSGGGLALTVTPDSAAPELPSGTIHVIVCRPVPTTEDETAAVPNGAAFVVGGKASSNSSSVPVSGVYDVATFGETYTNITLIPLRSSSGTVVMGSPGTVRTAISVALTLPFSLPRDSQLTMSLPTAGWAFDVPTTTCSLSVASQGKGVPVVVSAPVTLVMGQSLPTLNVTLTRAIPVAVSGSGASPAAATIVCGGIIAPIANQASELVKITLHYPPLPLGPGESLSRPRVITYTAQHPPVEDALNSGNADIGILITLSRTTPLPAALRASVAAAVFTALDPAVVAGARVHNVRLGTTLTTVASASSETSPIIAAMALAADAVGARRAVASPANTAQVVVLIEPAGSTTQLELEAHVIDSMGPIRTALGALFSAEELGTVMVAGLSVPSTCKDGEQNYWETGVDCGIDLAVPQACAQCEDLVGCIGDYDCLSLRCTEGTCQPYTMSTSGAMRLLTSPAGVMVLTAAAAAAGFLWVGRRVEE